MINFKRGILCLGLMLAGVTVPAHAGGGVYLYTGFSDIAFGGNSGHTPPTMLGFGVTAGGENLTFDFGYGFTIADGETTSGAEFQLNQTKLMLNYHTSAASGDAFFGLKGGLIMTSLMDSNGNSIDDDSKPAYGFVFGAKDEFDLEFLISSWNPDDAMPEDDSMFVFNFRGYF